MVKVAVCQYATELGDKERNVALSLEWLDRAGRAGADLVVLPELITTGYCLGDELLELAEPVPGPVTELWAEKARRYGYYLVAGLCRCDADVPSLLYNSAVLIGPDGRVEGVYSKVALPLYLGTWLDDQGNPMIWQEAEFFRRGNSLPVFQTALGTVGIQICQDAVYPEFTRVQVLKGAQIVVQLFNAVAIPTAHEADITALLSRAHAFDNSVFIVAANKCGVETYDHAGKTCSFAFYGESHVVDPRGNFVAKAAPEVEELLVAEIDPGEVRKVQWQTKFIRDWRPELLTPLCSGE
jgi:beta-ureidopropionase